MTSRRISILSVIGILILFPALFVITADASQETSGYILGSRVNVRSLPSAASAVVTTATIGTPVRWSEASNGWCKVNLVRQDSIPGFVLCELLTDKKPTVASIDKDLARSDLKESQVNDLLERRFFLSPSLNTIGLIRQRRKMGNEDEWISVAGKAEDKPYCIQIQQGPERLCAVMLPGSDDYCVLNKDGLAGFRCEEVRKGAATQVQNHEYVGALMDAFRGDVSGADFQPVDLRINTTVVGDAQNSIENQTVRKAVKPTKKGDPAPPSAGSPITEIVGSLPNVTKSLFQNNLDVMASGVMDTWSSADEDDASAKKWALRQNGYIEEVPPDSLVWSFHTNSDVIEFSKLTPSQQIKVDHKPLKTVRGWKNYYFGWYKTGSVDIRFVTPPQVVMIANAQLVPLTIQNVRVELGRGYCSSPRDNFIVTVKTDKPVRTSGVMLMLAPDVHLSGAKNIGSKDDFVMYDLNDDGVADMAYAKRTTIQDNGLAEKFMYVFLNIGGTWRLSSQEHFFNCD